jgi:hypothetical protein
MELHLSLEDMVQNVVQNTASRTNVSNLQNVQVKPVNAKTGSVLSGNKPTALFSTNFKIADKPRNGVVKLNTQSGELSEAEVQKILDNDSTYQMIMRREDRLKTGKKYSHEQFIEDRGDRFDKESANNVRESAAKYKERYEDDESSEDERWEKLSNLKFGTVDRYTDMK